MAKDEMVFHGGPFDGLRLNVSDVTMSWPMVITLEMATTDGSAGDRIINAKAIAYSIVDSGEDSMKGDAWAHYEYTSSVDVNYNQEGERV